MDEQIIEHLRGLCGVDDGEAFDPLTNPADEWRVIREMRRRSVRLGVFRSGYIRMILYLSMNAKEYRMTLEDWLLSQWDIGDIARAAFKATIGYRSMEE